MAHKSSKIEFSAFLRDVRGLFLVLRPDLVILDASPAYLQATLTRREEILGRSLFDVFPDNPSEPGANGVRRLRASLQRALSEAVIDTMPKQRYDVPDRVAADGSWVQKYWLPSNTPVFGAGSQEPTHLVHQVQDVTQVVELQRWLDEQALVNDEQLESLERILADLTARGRELQRDRKRAAALLRGRARHRESLAELEQRWQVPETRRYLGPGDRVPRNAIYRAYHARSCSSLPTRVFASAGSTLVPCGSCAGSVRYRLEQEL